ncbi:MAG: hypothetical protein LAT64_06375 [Phycisphaerales bacterium]|nr:hypothetical protein [Planctomycetota bacterium]MCH8508381.1 hypothetical protein [Phycisphaerales bacterium]
MLREFANDWAFFSKSLIQILIQRGHSAEAELLKSSSIRVEETDWDNWNGGMPVYTVFVEVTIQKFAELQHDLNTIESLLSDASLLLKRLYSPHVVNFSIIPSSAASGDIKVLKELIGQQKHLMISVSTGGPKIEAVQAEYAQRRSRIAELLRDFGLDDPNPFSDLWQWYAKWSTDIPKWAPRRKYIADLYQPLLDALDSLENSDISLPPATGWERVDRILAPMPAMIAQGRNEEDFQAVGHKCREAIISAAQYVYQNSMAIHLETTPSSTDSKRMLDAFLTDSLPGESRKLSRRICNSAVDLANELTHRRSATQFDAKLCYESTKSVVALVHCVHANCQKKVGDPAMDYDDIPF